MAAAKKKRNSAMELCLHFPPFLVHVALVLIVGWIGSRLNWNLAPVFAFGLAYLYFVEGRIKAKSVSRIRSEERRANDRKRLLSDAETARWLNSTVEAVWPIFLENFASQKFLMSLAPWFFEKYKPRTAKNIVLQHICLGRYPPVFSMLRCGRNPTDGDHLVLEMDMKFAAARDMRAVIAVQMRKRVGLGLWTSLNISNIQIEGKLRVGVRFTKGWPVVERLRVCFAEAPILRMTAKPIINYGIDVTDIPGLASWIDKMIADALEHSLVEPNVLEVDVEKLVGSLMAVNSQLQTPIKSKRGPWFSVGDSNVPRIACLTVEILEAKKLKPSDPNGKADPYVKVRLGSTKFVTAIKHKTLQPAWYETFHFPVESWDMPNKLQLVVRDFDRYSHDDNLGYKEIECKEFNDGQRHEMWVTLDEVKTGQLHIAITVEDVPEVALKEGAKTRSSLEGGKTQSDVPPGGEKVTDDQGDENDQDCPDSDYEECSLRGQREALDVGYGHLGAVSIVTPGKAKVKEATNLERLRQRKKPAASTVQMDGGGTSADFTYRLGVTTERRRSKLKRFWRKDKKSSSQSDSSGELGIIAMGEKGTEVHMIVEADGEGVKDLAPEGIPSSGELQVDGGEGHYEDSRAEKSGMKKVQNIMHRIGKKAHTMSSAISKMSPSKKRSHSGKNLGDIPANASQADTDMPEALSSTHEAGGDMENLQTEITSQTRREVNDIENSKEIYESEAGKDDPSRVPVASSVVDMKELPRAQKLRRMEGLRDEGNLKCTPAEKPVHHTNTFLAGIKKEARDTSARIKIDCKAAASTAESLIHKIAPSHGRFTRSPGVSATTTSSAGGLLTVVAPRSSVSQAAEHLQDVFAVAPPEAAELARATEPAVEHADLELRSGSSVPCVPALLAPNTPVTSPSSRRESPRTPGGIGSSSARSFFSRITAFKDRGTRNSHSSKELSSVAAVSFVPEAKNREDKFLSQAEYPYHEGCKSVDCKSAELPPQPTDALSKDKSRRQQERSEVANNAGGFSESLSSTSNDYRETSLSAASVHEDTESATRSSSGSEVGKDEISSGSQHPTGAIAPDETLVSKCYEESTGFTTKDEISRGLVTRPLKSLKAAGTAVHSSLSRIHGFREASPTLPTPPEALTEGPIVFSSGKNETGGRWDVACSLEEKSSEDSGVHLLPGEENLGECSKDILCSRSTSAESFFSRTRGFKRPGHGLITSFTESVPPTDPFTSCNQEYCRGKDETNKTDEASYSLQSSFAECATELPFSSIDDQFSEREHNSSDVRSAESSASVEDIRPGDNTSDHFRLETSSKEQICQEGL